MEDIKTVAKFYHVYQAIYPNFVTKFSDWFRKHNVCDPDEIDSNGLPLFFICFEIADYIESFFIKKHDSFSSTFENLSEQRGIFKCETSNNFETHAFVIAITDDAVLMMSGYGGYDQLISVKFERKDWFRSILQINTLPYKQQRLEIKRIFDLPEHIWKTVYPENEATSINVKNIVVCLELDLVVDH